MDNPLPGIPMKLSSEAKSRLAAEWVLGTQSARVRRRLTRLREQDGEFARCVIEWEERVAAVSVSLPAVAPPTNHWQRIANEIARDSQPTLSKAPFWRQLWFWQSWSLTASGIALMLALIPRAPGVSEPIPVLNDVLSDAERATDAAGTFSTQTATPELTLPAPQIAPENEPSSAPVVVSSPDQHSTIDPENSALVVDETTVVTNTPVNATPVADAEISRRAEVFSTIRGQGDAAASAALATPIPLAILADEAGKGAWVVRFDSEAQRLLVRALNAPTDNNVDYQLWSVAEDGGVRSLGLMPRDGGELGLDNRQRRSLRQAQLLAVSIEPLGGSTGDAPSGAVMYTGEMLTL